MNIIGACVHFYISTQQLKVTYNNNNNSSKLNNTNHFEGDNNNSSLYVEYMCSIFIQLFSWRL